ncbi:MAG TPA: winged helix DNA-binding domain-containing protein [Candidatus Avipropionibacterium avicola]|uniref:Winged helix DNA-binding domain-containing protein n=1 Tax=Candidatus Avipropionibacterium avicola TaxID=2840701 RepID=A0A9D1GW91_9ACTN|nr:winged helix DNA-binding domain-containing protein [Candidatus Avipropionibacterium avicola]
MEIDPARALGWRLGVQGLEPSSVRPVGEVVDRMFALRGWPLDRAELAVAVRQPTTDDDVVQRALDSGELIRSYAFRGGSYVFTHQLASIVLTVRTATGMWRSRRWQDQGGFVIDDWEPLRDAVREMLSDGPCGREEISAELAKSGGLRDLAPAALGAGADSLYKPLHWWGDICFGPTRDGRATFRRLDDDPRWPGPPDVDQAGRDALRAFIAGYGPVTEANLQYCFTEGLSVPRKRVRGWLDDLGDRIVGTGSGDTAAWVRADDLEQIRSSEPSAATHLLPGHDPWLMVPGTADRRLIDPAHRAAASRGANLVIRGGVVVGTWRGHRDSAEIDWFDAA